MVAGFEAVSEVEAMSVRSNLIARELDSVTAGIASSGHRLFKQQTADPLRAIIWMDVE
jgi:hypothetical protein